jgi:hypothetical protein
MTEATTYPRDDTRFLQEFIDRQDYNRTRSLTLPHGRWRITKPLRITLNRPITETDRFTIVSDVMGLNCDIVAPGLPSPYDFVIERLQ